MLKILRNSILILLIGIPFCSWSQVEVWPGDVNNNGIVDMIDVQWFTYAQSVMPFGFPRSQPEMGFEWEPKDAPTWFLAFPNGLDFANADCNGDGHLDDLDFFIIVYANYQFVNPPIETIPFTDPQPGIDIPMHIETFQEENYEDEGGFAIINIGNMDMPAVDCYSLSFILDFDHNIIDTNSIQLSFITDWTIQGMPFGPNYSAVRSIQPGKLECVVSSTNGMPLFNNGISTDVLALVGYIIEEDVIGIMEDPVDTDISISRIYYLNDSVRFVPVVGDTTTLTVYPTTTSTKEQIWDRHVQIMPNPSSGLFNLVSHDWSKFESYRVLDIRGQVILESELPSRIYFQVNLLNYSDGVYQIQFIGKTTLLTKKVVKFSKG